MALTAQFRADFDQFTRAVKTAEGDLRTFDRSTSQAIGSVKGTISGLGSAFAALGPMIAGAFSIAAIKSAVSSYVEFTSTIGDLSAKTGIGIEALQRLKYAAEQNGVSLEQVTTAATKLGVNLAGGNKSAIGALKALGLSFDEIRQKGPDKAMADIADAAAKIADPMAKAKLYTDLYGKSGTVLIQMEEDLRATMEAADRLGIVLSEKTVKAGKAFGDQMTTLSAVGRGLIAQVLEPMIPALSAIAQWAGDAVPAALTKARETIDWLVRSALQAQVTLFEMAVKAAELAQKMPTLRNLMGESAKDTALYRGHLQQAQDALAGFESATVKATAANQKSGAGIKALNLDYEGNAKKARDAAKAIDDAAKFTEDWEESKRKDREELMRMDRWLTQLNARLSVTGDELLDATDKMMKLGQVTSRMTIIAREFGGDLNRMIVPLKETVRAIPSQTAWEFAWGNMKDGLKSVLDGLPQLFTNAFTGGGGVMGAIKAIGVQIAEAIARPIFEAISSAITRAVTARAVGSVAGGAGAAGGGAAIGGLSSAAIIGGIFTGGALLAYSLNQQMKSRIAEMKAIAAAEAELMKRITEHQAALAAVGLPVDLSNWGFGKLEEMTALLAEFEDRIAATNDAFAPLLQSASELGIRLPESILKSLRQLTEMGVLLGQNADLVGQLNDASVIDWKKMEEAAKRYGINVDALGQTFNQLRNNDAAKQIINDFDLMARGGVDVGTMLLGMSEEISALVNNSIAARTTLPENMRPWIESLQQAGKLIGPDGLPMELEDLGDIRFAAPIKTEFEKITESLEKLIETLNVLGDALKNLPKPNIGGGIAAGPDIWEPPVLPGTIPTPLPAFAPSAGASFASAPLQIVMDRKVVADAVIEVAGGRLSLRGAR